MEVAIWGPRREQDAKNELQERLNAVLRAVNGDHEEAVKQWVSYLECMSTRDLDDDTGMILLGIYGRLELRPDAVFRACIDLFKDGNDYTKMIAHELCLPPEPLPDKGMAAYSRLLSRLYTNEPATAVVLMRHLYNNATGERLIALLDSDADFSRIQALLAAKSIEPLKFLETWNSNEPHQANINRWNRHLDMQPHWLSFEVHEELTRLGRSQKWWVRLWVAEFMRQLPELRDYSTWQFLQKDDVDIVRERTTLPVKIVRNPDLDCLIQSLTRKRAQ